MPKCSTLSMLVLLSACSTSFNSGLPNGKALSDLSEDEMCTLQEEASDWFDNTRRDVCYVQGQAQGIAASVQGEDFVAACEATFDACMEDLGEFEDYTCEPEEVPSTCEATVGDLEACVGDSAKTLSDLAKTRCTEIDVIEYAQAASELEGAPESCEPLGETCPFSVGF